MKWVYKTQVPCKWFITKQNLWLRDLPNGTECFYTNCSYGHNSDSYNSIYQEELASLLNGCEINVSQWRSQGGGLHWIVPSRLPSLGFLRHGQKALHGLKQATGVEWAYASGISQPEFGLTTLIVLYVDDLIITRDHEKYLACLLALATHTNVFH